MNQDFLWPCVCVFAGLCVLVFGIVIRKKLKVSESWPKTIGVISESKVERGFTRIGGSYRYTYIVSPKVIYEYQVSGVKYTSSQLALVEFSTANEDLAEAKANNFRPGQSVEVFYNPKKPAFAVLKIGDPTNGKLPWGIIIFGVLLAISGSIWICANQHQFVVFTRG